MLKECSNLYTKPIRQRIEGLLVPGFKEISVRLLADHRAHHRKSSSHMTKIHTSEINSRNSLNKLRANTTKNSNLKTIVDALASVVILYYLNVEFSKTTQK